MSNSVEIADNGKNNELLPDNIPEGSSWQNPGEFPDFIGSQPKTNVDRLQELLDKVGFNDLRKDDERFRKFLKTTDKQDIHRYISHINQSLREISPKERGFHKGRMAAGELLSPSNVTQVEVLDYGIDALSEIEDLRYRATSAYYLVNNLHMFGDGNGRTARAIFELLDNPDASISEQQSFLSHSDNKRDRYDFQDAKNIIDITDFNQLAMLAFLEKLDVENDNDGFVSELKSSLESGIKSNGGNIFMIYGGLEDDMPGETDIGSLHGIPGFELLNDSEREQVCDAFRYDEARVSTSALAMWFFYKEKNEENDFLNRIRDDMGEYNAYIINIDPGECENWSKEDFLHYAELSESIKEKLLKISMDIFVNPDKYRYFGKSIAEVATNAKEFYGNRD